MVREEFPVSLNIFFLLNYFLIGFSLTKKKEFRPKYPELLEQPFIKKSEVQKVDVASWLASVMEIAGLKTRRR